NCTGSGLGHDTSTWKVTLNQAVPPGGTTSSPCSASPSLVAPGGMPGAPDWAPALMIVTVPSPPAISQDGEMASQGDHCCESARSPPIGRMGLTCPRVTVVPERL